MVAPDIVRTLMDCFFIPVHSTALVCHILLVLFTRVQRGRLRASRRGGGLQLEVGCTPYKFSITPHPPTEMPMPHPDKQDKEKAAEAVRDSCTKRYLLTLAPDVSVPLATP